MTDWVRLWHDMPTDPKWRVIARKSGQPLPCVIALFTLLMTTASAADDRGDVESLNVEDAAAALDMDEDQVEAILSAMDGRVISDGRLSGWERRQPKREDDSAKRVKEHRERKKAQAKRVVTQRNAPETEEIREEDTPPTPLAGGEAGELISYWNEMASRTGLSAVESFGTDRERNCRARLNEHGLAKLKLAVDAVEASPHCRGENDRQWRATFDFIFQAKSFGRLIEGGYGPKPGAPAKPKTPPDPAVYERLKAKGWGGDVPAQPPPTHRERPQSGSIAQFIPDIRGTA